MSAEKCVQNEHIENQVFRVSDEFGQLTGPRLARHGSCSGEALRIKIAEKLKTIGSGKLTVILDDVHGYGSSFLEEAFAGLVRHWEGDLDHFENKIEIVSNSALYRTYVSEARLYMNSALRWKRNPIKLGN